jgi:excisionase family DNA binding protein
MVVWIDDEAYLTAEETCDLLGVKRQTLYAYVSRGLIRSFRQGIRRQRLYLRREVDALRRLGPGRDLRDGGPDQPGAGGRALRSKGIPRAEEWIGDA